METELLKAVANGGAVVAVIAVVVLFLRQQVVFTGVLKDITVQFASDSNASQKLFQEQIREVMGRTDANQRLYQEQIKGLIDDHMTVTRETVGAVKSLDATVRSVEATVRSVEATVRELQTVVRVQGIESTKK